MNIEKIDFKNKDQLNNKFTKSLKETGFAVITNFEVEDLNGIYEDWFSYFRQPLEEKLENKFDSNLNKQSGYFPFRSENAKDQEVPDLKEFYHIFNSKDVPETLNKKRVVDFFNTMKNLGHQLLQIIDNDLKTSTQLSDSIIDGPTLLRPIYYPEVSEKEVGTRAAAHEDINLITLLPASTALGLEAKDINGVWHQIDTNPGDIVINVGDMLQMFSQGKYVSTTHRVVNMPGDRLSMPMFVHPNPNFELGPMTAGEYLNLRLSEIGLK